MSPAAVAEVVDLLTQAWSPDGAPPVGDDAVRAAAVGDAVDLRFIAESSPTLDATVADFKRQPARHQAAFRLALDELLRRDPDFAAELDGLLAVPAPANDAADGKAPGRFAWPLAWLTRSRTPLPLPPGLRPLYDGLSTLFSQSELDDVALTMNFAPGDIRRDNRLHFARGLVLACWRAGKPKLRELQKEAARLRPYQSWPLTLVDLPDRPSHDYDDKLNYFVSLFSDTRQVLAFLGVVLVVAAAVGIAVWYSRQPRRMTAGFNVAVAQLVETPENAAGDLGAVLSRQIATELSREYDNLALDEIAVSAENMPRVASPQQARDLANRVNANVVIYGTVERVGNWLYVRPGFSVHDPYRPDVAELNGDYGLDAQIVYDLCLPPADCPASVLPSAEVGLRSTILTDFTKALVYMSSGDLPAARAAIDRALRTSDEYSGRYGEYAGEEVLYVTASYISQSQGEAPAAEAYASRALGLNPNYGRGHIALANVYYTTGQLAAARDAYVTALALPDQPAEALVPEKAHFGLGNVLSAQLLDVVNNPAATVEERDRLAEESLGHYEAVLSAFDSWPKPDIRLQTMAADSQALIGRVYHALGRLQPAAEAYRAALSMTPPPRPTTAAVTEWLLATVTAGGQ